MKFVIFLVSGHDRCTNIRDELVGIPRVGGVGVWVSVCVDVGVDAKPLAEKDGQPWAKKELCPRG